jgi:DNA polymerase-3 subunit beta
MAEAAEKLDNDVIQKLSLERGEFLKALGRIQGIVEKRNTIPILANILLVAGEGTLTLTATDMDMVAKETIPANVEIQGATTVPAHTLFDIIRKLKEGSSVTLEALPATGQVHVESGQAKFDLSYLPAEDFTVLSEGEFTSIFKLAAKDCEKLIDKARFAMSTEETRYYLNGVYLHEASNDSGDPVLRAVATDGHRLARIEMPLPSGASGMPGIIIPRKAVGELKKLTEENTGEIEISLSESKIKFATDNVVLLSKLIDGTFPDYERVIPEGNDKIMEVDTKLLIQAVDRVSTISSEKTKGIKLELDAGKMHLSANSPESGQAEEDIEVVYASEKMEIGFNSRYMLDMLSQMEGDTVQFILSDSTAPAVTRDPSDVGALFVIMPMRV